MGNDRAALFQNGSIVDLGTLGGSATSIALAINNVGQVVGGSFFITSPPSSGEYHAFLYKSGVMNDIGNGIAAGINDNGEVVGEGNDGTSYGFAFLYTITRGLLNVNNYVVNLSNGTTPGFTKLLNANAINGQGDIVGFGNYFDGTKTILAGFLLIKIGK